jgi:hypothetical protein
MHYLKVLNFMLNCFGQDINFVEISKFILEQIKRGAGGRIRTCEPTKGVGLEPRHHLHQRSSKRFYRLWPLGYSCTLNVNIEKEFLSYIF